MIEQSLKIGNNIRSVEMQYIIKETQLITESCTNEQDLP